MKTGKIEKYENKDEGSLGTETDRSVEAYTASLPTLELKSSLKSTGGPPKNV